MTNDAQDELMRALRSIAVQLRSDHVISETERHQWADIVLDAVTAMRHLRIDLDVAERVLP